MSKQGTAIQTLDDLKSYLKGLQFSFEGDVSGRYSYDDLDNIPLFPNQYMYVANIQSLSLPYKRDIEKVLGMKDSKFTPVSMYKAIHPDQQGLIMEATRLSFEYAFAFQLFSYDYSFAMDYKFKHKKGHYIDIMRQSSFFEFDQNGMPVSILSIATDITHHKVGEGVGWHVHGFESELTDLTGLLSNLTEPHEKVLSDREIEITRFLADGLSSKEVGDQLFISSHTVDTHRRKILKKLGLKNVVELVMFALKHGYLKE